MVRRLTLWTKNTCAVELFQRPECAEDIVGLRRVLAEPPEF
ncbi:MAG: hypothetical protein AB7Q01_01985 [Gammaproteobacteria bacterium]|jgi:hypothetical protein